MVTEDMKQEMKVPKRILDALLSSLSAGVVPRSGAPYIAIGRAEEIAALLENLDTVADGGAAVRFLIGRYGSGKSFLIQLLRGYALDRGFVTADVDLSPERRLCGGNSSGLFTYRELLRNMATKAAPDGGALPMMLSRQLSRLKSALVEEGILPDTPAFHDTLKKRLFRSIGQVEGHVGGFDFAAVLSAYYQALLEEAGDRQSACLRWLRGEYANKTEAKAALGFSVSTVINDDNWYDFIKLWAGFSVQIGYVGLVVFIDECVNLYKIPNRISREANYEKLLSIFNDTLQGRAQALGVIFSGTPQFLEDPRRGLFSYEALRSRLADSRFTELGYANFTAPVIRLRRMSDNELLALLARLTRLWEQRYPAAPLVSGEQMQHFLSQSLARAGADELLTPREMIRNYLTLLAILRDNPETTFEQLWQPSVEHPSGKPEEDGEGGGVRTVQLFDLQL
ncbi:MAG: ATP-binding protein [Eubacteriales bacterium]